MTNTASKRAGSLTFPSDPLAAMRELSDLDAPPVTVPAAEAALPVLTDSRESVSTEVRTDASTDVSQQARTDGSAEGSAEVRPQVRTGTRKASRSGVAPGPSLTEADLVAFVEERLASREPLIGGVKATVDMSPELSSRAKRYLADHRGQSTRQILIELFDAFLTVKGY